MVGPSTAKHGLIPFALMLAIKVTFAPHLRGAEQNAFSHLGEQPRSVPAELQAIVPALPSVPVQPLIEGSDEPYAMFRDLVVRDAVLKLRRYRNLQDLLASFDEVVIAPAETKLKDLKIARLRALEKL